MAIVVVIANTQQTTKNMSAEQVHSRIFVSSVEFCKFKFDDDRKDNRDNKTEIQGPPSPVGATGQQGIQGPPGPQGETGLQGLNRINSTSVYFSGGESSSNTSNSGIASSVAM